jgi:hypothetical protein
MAANTAAPAAPSAPPPDYYGHFELHQFSDAALFTGIAYDSVPQVSYSWFTCPTSPSVPAGSSLPTDCVSPTTPPGSTTPLPTYYQLTQTKQAQVAAIEGISLYPWLPKDMFTQDTMPGFLRYLPTGLFLGGSAYPLNHYFAGASLEPYRGVSLTGGVVFGSETQLPKDFPTPVLGVTQANPSIPTTSSLKKGFFVMVAFHTSLFGQIFKGSVFQNVVGIPTAGMSAPPAAPAAAGPGSN